MKKIRSLAVASLFVLSVASAFAMTFTENFTSDPSLDGWQVFGNPDLFHWESANQNVAVTWNSTNANSYFYHPLGITLNSASNFMFAVDFTLQDIAIGTTPGKPQNFQVAFGLLNLAEATNDGFIVGTGYSAPDILELDYFPDSGYGASVTTPIISSGNHFAPGGFTYPPELVPGALYHAVLIFNVDTPSINCYSDAGQDTNEYFGVIYAGSIVAHGSVNNLFFATPLPVTQIIITAPCSIQFSSTTNWNYVLERTADFQSGRGVPLVTIGAKGTFTLPDTNPPVDKAF